MKGPHPAQKKGGMGTRVRHQASIRAYSNAGFDKLIAVLNNFLFRFGDENELTASFQKSSRTPNCWSEVQRHVQK